MTYYITTDVHSIAIQGIGSTEVEALADAIQNAGPVDEPPEAFITYEATSALYTQVEDEGGAIAWGFLPDGTACTIEEEEALA